MPVDALAVANYYIAKAVASGEPVTQVKLQKLVYFAQGWHLALTGESLLDEEVQAWSFGPIIFSILDTFSDWGEVPLTALGSRLVFDEPPKLADKGRLVVPILTAKQLEEYGGILQRVWDVYGKLTDDQLSQLTRDEGSPWTSVREEFSGRIPRYAVIPRRTMKEFFVAKAVPAA